MKPVVPVRWLGRVAVDGRRASCRQWHLSSWRSHCWSCWRPCSPGQPSSKRPGAAKWLNGMSTPARGSSGCSVCWVWNILAATLIRWPWRKRQVGFVVTHAGLLVLLVGAMQTFQYGIEGQVTLREGDRTDKVLLRHRSLITVERPNGAGRLVQSIRLPTGSGGLAGGKDA